MKGNAFSNDEDVRQQIREHAEEMYITGLFVDHPCKMICLPYCLLMFCAMVAFSKQMFNIATENNEDNLLLSDPILIESNIVKLSGDYLGIEALEKAKEDELKEKYRHSTAGFGSIGFILYQNTDDNQYGLLKKEYLTKIVDLEIKVINYN